MAKRKPLNFSKALVLNRFLLSHFGLVEFKPFIEALSPAVFEGRDENNYSKYYHEIKRLFLKNGHLSEDQLLEYDQNIVRHTQRINENRRDPIEWKYFQYLTLLFTEIYLDKYFRSREGLLYELNAFLDQWNDPNNDAVPNPEGVQFTPFMFEDLNKLAYWNATGSGKTLLMHINILQYEHWRLHHNNVISNKILLVTPNEGLSAQHLVEFEASNIPADSFSKKVGGVFSGKLVEVIEISKLAENHGEKTVAFEAFETNNLVLIDEGHRGVAGDKWKYRRDYLSQDGFAFEYSATFGQSVASASGSKKKSLIDEYAKTILFDYSYKFFYRDGYGKDYHILNLPEAKDEVFVRKYLTGALLSFYQQKIIFSVNPQWVNQFLIANPLWIFVGSTVTKTLNKSDKADVPRILKFFQWFIADTTLAKEYLKLLLSGKDGLVDQQNRSIFLYFFDYIRGSNFSIDDLYNDILARVFNTSISGARLYADNLRDLDGELGLRIGDCDYFGVINIGDDNELFKLCQSEGIPGSVKDFSDSLFRGINENDSKVNILIGAKKFTEGWSSWRVSTMGLMNVGRGEGSQIIQLFGRGVRLRGYNWSLKRSTMLDEEEKPDFPIPHYLNSLETLNIFGIRSDYMQQFKEILEEEGLPTNDSKFLKVNVPILPQVRLDKTKLKILSIREGIDFKKDVRLELSVVENGAFRPVVLDWYPKIQVLHKAKSSKHSLVEENYTCIITKDHKAFVDWTKVYFELQKFKNERSWYNLSITEKSLSRIITENWWYSLEIPTSETKINTFDRVRLWEEIVIALLKAYIDRFYNRYKTEYLSKHMKTEWLTQDHPNFEHEYEILIEESQTQIIRNVSKLAEVMKNNSFDELKNGDLGPNFTAFNFLQHLYKPLLYINQTAYEDIVKLSPVALNKGEWTFVTQLKDYYLKNTSKFNSTQMCLMRNQSQKGVGFFEAHGFYPDFILWLIDRDIQHIAFIDPKGLRQVTGLNHPKIRFFETVKKDIEPRLKDPEVNLNSFIVTPTTYAEVKHWDGGHSLSAFNRNHVYFMTDQKDSYIESILKEMVN